MNIMDLNSFLDEMDHDSKVVGMIVTELINAIQEQIPLMTTLLEEKDYKTLSREAHSIKGGARNIMADGLEKSSEQLEKAAATEDSNGSEFSLGQLELEFQRFKEFVAVEVPEANL